MAAPSGHGAVDIASAMITTPIPYGDYLVILPTIITILGGVLCLMARKATRTQPRIALIMLGLLVCSNIGLMARVLDKGVVTLMMGQWLPPYGIAFTADATGAVLALVASIIAFATALYAIADTGTTTRRYGFYPFLMLLMTGVSGAFLTGDIFNLYVWFEVLLISSYGLLVVGSSKAQLDGTVKYGVLNLIGTTLFLIATGYLYGLVGTLNMADIPGSLARLPDRAPITTVTMLYLVAFAMKAAAFPVNFWLPASYHTPRMAAAAIFAGLLTKVGAYALLRTMVMLLPGHREILGDVIAAIAIATMLTGVLGAIAQSDLRRGLGYLIISGIGTLMAGVAIATPHAVTGTIVYIVHSIIVMTALYFTAGLVGRMAGSFDLRKIGGLYHKSPLLAACFFALGLSVAGLPPFSGFWPKVVLVKAALDEGWAWLAVSILLTGFLTTIAVGRMGLYAFWRGGPAGTPDGTAVAIGGGSENEYARPTRARAAAMWIAIGLLIALTTYIGVLPHNLVSIATTGAQTMIDPAPYYGSVFGGGSTQ